jgi:hypothetical protein
MSLQKQKVHKLTVEVARGTINSRQNGNSVRGTIIMVSMVLKYFVRGSLI